MRIKAPVRTYAPIPPVFKRHRSSALAWASLEIVGNALVGTFRPALTVGGRHVVSYELWTRGTADPLSAAVKVYAPIAPAFSIPLLCTLPSEILGSDRGFEEGVTADSPIFGVAAAQWSMTPAAMWAVSDATAPAGGSPAVDGERCAWFYVAQGFNDSALPGGVAACMSEAHLVSPGVEYIANGKYRQHEFMGNGFVRMRVEWIDAGGNLISADTTGNITPDVNDFGWHSFSALSAIAPAGAIFGRLLFEVYAPAQASSDLYSVFFDSASLVGQFPALQPDHLFAFRALYEGDLTSEFSEWITPHLPANSWYHVDGLGGSSLDGAMGLSGAGAAISMGLTPPTDASHGTGIWIDRTGLYGLNANVVETMINNLGKFLAGAGRVTIDSGGIQMAPTQDVSAMARWVDAYHEAMRIFAYHAVGGTEFAGLISVAQEELGSSKYAQLVMQAQGRTAGGAADGYGFGIGGGPGGAVSGYSWYHFSPYAVLMTLSPAGALAVAGAITSGGVAVVLTTDARMSDARTPAAHAASHAAGAGDALAVDAAAGTGSLRTLGSGATAAAAGNHTHAEAAAKGCRVYNSSALSINDSSLTRLTFNSERWDTDGCHSISSNQGRLTAATAGKYLITGNLAFDANAAGMRSAAITLNVGGTIIASDARLSIGAGGRTQINISTIYDLAVNDYVELYCYQTSGGPLNVATIGNHTPEFGMVRIGP